MNPHNEEIKGAIQTLKAALPSYALTHRTEALPCEIRCKGKLYHDATATAISGLDDLLAVTLQYEEREREENKIHDEPADWSAHDRAKVGLGKVPPPASPSLMNAVREIHNARYPAHPISPTPASVKGSALKRGKYYAYRDLQHDERINASRCGPEGEEITDV